MADSHRLRANLLAAANTTAATISAASAPFAQWIMHFG
jgi:hypothetical protein